MTTKTVSIEMTVVIDDDGLAFSNEDCTKMTVVLTKDLMEKNSWLLFLATNNGNKILAGQEESYLFSLSLKSCFRLAVFSSP